jgi:formylglycine-generating enzyme required for sulfatase activity
LTAHRVLEPAARLGTPPQYADMVHIRGGTFRMGSDRHYPEEAPVHRVTVDGFWIDRTPVTNAQFRCFVEETGHVTFAEIAPKPEDYPGALPHMLRAGSLVFSPPAHPISLGDWLQWWTFKFGASWRKPYGPGSSIKGRESLSISESPGCSACRRSAPLHTRSSVGREAPLCDKANVESAKCDVISGFPAAPGLHSTCDTSTFAPEHPEAECPLPAILY